MPHLPALELAMPGGCLVPAVPHPLIHRAVVSTHVLPPGLLPVPTQPRVLVGGPGASSPTGSALPLAPYPAPNSFLPQPVLCCLQHPLDAEDEQGPLHTGCWGL